MKKILLLSIGLFISLSLLQAQDGSNDPSFNFDGNNFGEGANSSVYAIVLQPDGKILIAGDFTSYNGTEIIRIARLNPDGSLDPSFDPGTGPEGFAASIRTMSLQPDGKILIGGVFTSFDGVDRNYIARLNADGSLDASFDPGTGASSFIFALALQSDGKILIGGDFAEYNGTGRNGIARLNPDGSLDTFFNTGTGVFGGLRTIALQPDGKILVGGEFIEYNGISRNYIARLDSDGSLDTSFDPGTGFDGGVQKIAIQPDNKVIVGGFFTSFNGAQIIRVARLNADGSLDPSFDTGTPIISILTTLVLQSDGKILVGGALGLFARLDVNGNVDTGFDTGEGLNSTVLAIAVQPDGKVLVGGDFTSYDGADRGRINRVVNTVEITTDIEAPVPDEENLPIFEAQCVVNFADLKVPTATDNVDGIIQGRTDESFFPVTTQGSTLLTWTYTDRSGNISTQTQEILIEDTELPVIFASGDRFESAVQGTCAAAVVVSASATDNCGIGEPVGVRSDGLTFNDPYPVGVTTITWNVSDVNGNAAEPVIQTVTVIDSEFPTITAPAELNISTRENGCDAVDVALGEPAVSDNCGIESVTNDAPETYLLGTTTVTWTVTDNSGNIATATQTVTVVDDQDPLVSAPADVTIQIAPGADSATGVALGEAQASDNCGIESLTNNEPTTFPIGTTVVTWTATDNSGNTATATQNVTVTREVLPTITAPADINIDTDEGDCFGTVADLGTPSVTGEDIPADGISNDAPETFSVGTTVVTWTVRDGNGNTANATQQVTVSDTELPVIAAPAAIQTMTGATSCDAVNVALGEPILSDNCGISSVTNDAPEIYPLGATIVTWTVTDNSGNIATATQTVTVVDDQDPLVSAPADVTIQIAPDADSATGVALGEAQASDNCGVASVTNNAPTTFPIGTTVVTWTATDNSGNTATATQNVTVTREVLPTITAPAAISVDTDAGDCFATLADLGTPSVTGEDIPADGISNDSPETFPVGTTVVTWTVRDGNGNTATATQQVTVTDRELPVITAPASVQTSTGTTSCDAVDVALGQATVSDNCGIASVTNDAPETYPLGTTTVTWTVTDNNGNVATATQTVTVVDDQDPLVSAPADVTIQIAPDADSATGVALGEAQTSDNCGIQSLTNDALDVFPLGLTVVTWTATDNSGNTATAQQRVNVTREELPTIQAPADITVDAGEGDCFAEGLELGSPTFTGTGATVSNDAPDQFPVGVTPVTWTVTDANGNMATAVQQVTVADRQAPQITAPGNITVSEGEGGEAPAIDLGNAVATDNCGIASIVNDAPAVFPVGMTVVTWTATDVNGNEATALQVVTVDAVTPVCTIQIKTKQEITVVLNKDGKGRLTTAMVDDGSSYNCAPYMLRLDRTEFGCADIGEQRVVFTVMAIDAMGTNSSVQVTIMVVDQTKPKVTVPQQPYVKVIRRGDTFVMPDLRNRVTASDNCGFELHQCPEPGKVFRNAQNGWIEFEAKDPSGNVGKGKMRFKLLVVGCRKPGKNGREELEGSEDLVTVPWNTPLPRIASDYVHFDEGSDMELANQIKWSISDFDPLKPGFYQMEGSLPAEYLEEGDNGPVVSLPVLVLNKPLPVDIFAAKDRVSYKVKTGEILTGLHTIDPADEIHSYAMDEHPDVYLENNVLVWRGNHMPEARTTVTVHSTDRAGQTISRQITLYREADRPTDLLIYPNPAMQETNLMVQIPEGANVSIRIFDAAGRLVYQEEGQQELSFTRKIDLRHFAQGMYQVIVQADRETLQGRIIKQ